MIDLVLAVVLATPTPPADMIYQTPPPEPNHVTIDIEGSVLKTASEGWQRTTGRSVQAAVRYEFQASKRTRLANTLHWARVTTSWDGGSGSFAFTAPYNYTLYDDEVSIELGRPEYPLGVGVGYYAYAPVFDGSQNYHLQTLGAGVDRWPNYYVPSSWYYSAWYYPNLHGGGAEFGTYDILRAEFGVNLRPNLTRDLNIKLGVQNESWFARSGGASTLTIYGPYIGLSFWR